jgi:hypothetical protein
VSWLLSCSENDLSDSTLSRERFSMVPWGDLILLMTTSGADVHQTQRLFVPSLSQVIVYHISVADAPYSLEAPRTAITYGFIPI